MLEVKLPYKPQCHKCTQHHEPVGVKCNLPYEPEDHTRDTTNSEVLMNWAATGTYS